MEEKPDKCEQGECDKADVSETQYADPNKANEEEFHPDHFAHRGEDDDQVPEDEEKRAKDKRKQNVREKPVVPGEKNSPN